MGGAWRHRVARDDEGKLHFVFARYDTTDPRQRRGMIGGVFNEGATIDEMKTLARDLLRACDDPIISMLEYEHEGSDDEDDDED